MTRGRYAAGYRLLLLKRPTMARSLASLAASLVFAPRPSSSGPAWLLECLIFGLAYGAAARLGLAYSSIAPNVTLIWAPTGISLFVFLRWGPRLWPGVVLGDLVANAGTGASVQAILGISAGNIAQTVLCLLALRYVGFDPRLARVRDAVALLGLGTAAAAVSACIGPAALWLDGVIPGAQYSAVWLQWWMGDATGVVVITPLLLAWCQRLPRLSRPLSVEAVLLLVVLGTLSVLVFSDALAPTPDGPGYYPAALALFPITVWAALRFGMPGATLVTLLVTVAAIWGTVLGVGPFVDGAQTGSLVRWWVFANVITVTGLLLAASQSERDLARAQAIRDRDFTTAILDTEGALVVVLDADGRIQRVNRSLESCTGFAAGDLIGRSFEEALIPQDQHAKVRGHADLLRSNVSDRARHESGLRRRGGLPVTVSWTATALRGADGRMTHAIVSGVDISARVEAADALRHARRQLEARVAERTRDLAEANRALQAAMVERQRLEGEVIRISEREQQRIGRELHDGLGQHLTAAAIQTELLARDLEALGIASARQSAEQIEAMVSDAVAQTRLLARGLFPVEMGEGGLLCGLDLLAETTRQQLRRACTLDCPEPVEVTDHDVAVHLYRIAQEAVNNAVKHAPGSPIAIELHRHGDGVRLSVVNPLAAADQTPAAGRGIGLEIMQHRAQLIGARWSARAQAGLWRVTAIWPGEAAVSLPDGAMP
jgi:PAS domain S-box-containing protein